LECAVRETHEETGLDVAELIDPSQYVCIGRPSGRYLKLFVVPGIATSVALRPRSVREIHTAEWFDLCDLEALATMDAPAARGFRSVAAILPKLQAWIYHYHMAQANTYGGRRSLPAPIPMMPMRRSRIGVGNGYRYTECETARTKTVAGIGQAASLSLIVNDIVVQDQTHQTREAQQRCHLQARSRRPARLWIPAIADWPWIGPQKKLGTARAITRVTTPPATLRSLTSHLPAFHPLD